MSPRTFPAGVHRLPEHVSIGLEVSLTAFLEADSFHAGLLSSPNSVSTGLALMIGSREADLTQIPGAAPWGAAPPAGALGGRVEIRDSATALFIHSEAA